MSKGTNKKRKLIIENKNNLFIKFWNFCWNIYYDKEELFNYLIVGGLTTVISIGSKMILLKTIFDQTNGYELQYAEIISWFIAVMFAYIMNRLIVFKSKEKNIIKEICSFISGRIFTQLLQMLIMFIFVTLLTLNSDFFVIFFTIIGQLLQIIFNYIISKLLIFKKG